MNISLSNKIAYISAKDYIKNYRDSARFIKLCKQCSRYGKTWACPPFNFNTDKYIEGYEHVYIIGTKVKFDECRQPKSIEERDKLSNQAMYIAIDKLKRVHEKVLLEFPETVSFLVGPCRICSPEPCARLSGLLCRHPNEVRHSIESVGFDVGKTTSELLGIELKWGIDNNLPEYITLVTALFTKYDKDLFGTMLEKELDIINKEY